MKILMRVSILSLSCIDTSSSKNSPFWGLNGSSDAEHVSSVQIPLRYSLYWISESPIKVMQRLLPFRVTRTVYFLEKRCFQFSIIDLMGAGASPCDVIVNDLKHRRLDHDLLLTSVLMHTGNSLVEHLRWRDKNIIKKSLLIPKVRVC